jgi:hypothetical protein
MRLCNYSGKLALRIFSIFYLSLPHYRGLVLSKSLKYIKKKRSPICIEDLNIFLF